METRPLKWTAEEDALLGKAESPLIAVVLERSVRDVEKRMRKLGILPFVPPSERKLPANARALKATRRLDAAIAAASLVGMGQTVPAVASKLRVKAETAERHLAYFMEIVRDDHRLGRAIPNHWKEAENTAPGLLNAAALRLSAELECGSLRPWCKPLKVTHVPTPYSTPTPV
ncbi:hypothetical protein [Xanthomonas translucens]|uniref:hypothetical protein n=1 Tax=Xanthomonas campestris pv. translucens TaxID=343 RepID=UPI0012D9ED75|nr:hypothetical protein [Xanthomonas translucens]UKE41859.1 hypothetical protein KCU58_19960 [Xanthomonas translucens pv. undulosa]UPU47167.1 hypothetical protein MZO50_00395 [Xanthomonas translucens pv. undulosa]UPU47202.1 hypothetical protein MZO50_00145 [Xanthomonas translucens pv. undulosa]